MSPAIYRPPPPKPEGPWVSRDGLSAEVHMARRRLRDAAVVQFIGGLLHSLLFIGMALTAFESLRSVCQLAWGIAPVATVAATGVWRCSRRAFRVSVALLPLYFGVPALVAWAWGPGMGEGGVILGFAFLHALIGAPLLAVLFWSGRAALVLDRSQSPCAGSRPTSSSPRSSEVG